MFDTFFNRQFEKSDDVKTAVIDGENSSTALSSVEPNRMPEALHITAFLKSHQGGAEGGGKFLIDVQRKTIEQNLQILLEERKKLQELESKYEAIRLLMLDYKMQGNELSEDSNVYGEKITSYITLQFKLINQRKQYIENLKSVIWSKDQSFSMLFKPLEIEKSEIADKKEVVSAHDAMMDNMRIAEENTERKLQVQSNNRNDAKLVADLLENQVANYEIENIIKILKSGIITKLVSSKDAANIFILVYPILHKLGYNNIIKDAFGEEQINEYISTFFDTQDLKNLEFSKIEKIITQDIDNIVRNKCSIQPTIDKLKLLLALKEDDIIDFRDENKRNILGFLIQEGMKQSLNNSQEAHTKSIIMVDSYMKLFEAVCENLDKETLAKLLHQRDKKGETPAQLFYRLANTGKKNNAIHIFSEAGVKWFKTIVRYTGSINLPSKNWREVWWCRGIYDACVYVLGKLIMKNSEGVLQQATSVNTASPSKSNWQRICRNLKGYFY